VSAALAVAAALAAGGCGGDFANDPRPPVPAQISVQIGPRAVRVVPAALGAGLANFTIANLNRRPASLSLELSGEPLAQSALIPPGGNGAMKAELVTGSYELVAEGLPVLGSRLEVGVERPSASNDLLLP
jgi:hypothetical protein